VGAAAAVGVVGADDDGLGNGSFGAVDGIRSCSTSSVLEVSVVPLPRVPNIDRN